MPDFVASPFKVRVWIPLTPDVPAPGLTLVSALISDGDNRNSSCAWTKEVTAAINKAVVNRIFMMPSSTYYAAPLPDYRESPGAYHLKRRDCCQSSLSRRASGLRAYWIRPAVAQFLGSQLAGMVMKRAKVTSVHWCPVRLQLPQPGGETRNDQTEKPWRQLHTTRHGDDTEPHGLWRDATGRSGSLGTTA